MSYDQTYQKNKKNRDYYFIYNNIWSDDEESSSACEYISSWLARMEKRLDFIYDYEEPEYGELEQGESAWYAQPQY